MPSQTAGQSKIVSLRLPVDMHERLVEIASREERTFSQHVRWLMDVEIARHGGQRPAPDGAAA